MEILLVSHFHWDREWYRTMQAFRARLVDAVDRVLALLDADPGYRFVLDGQAVVLEDYFAVRPDRRDDLAAAVRAGRLGVGPWYVQPDSLLPGAEAHVRNLLHGRRVASALGPVSRVAYVPDSFGHPAQLPQLLAGFGLDPFVYWRGDDETLDARGGPGARWCWVAPDGSAVTARHLGEGYFGAGGLDPDPARAAERLAPVVARLAAADPAGPVLLMNGFDHVLPDGHTAAVAGALAAATGATVRRGLLDDLRGDPAETVPDPGGGRGPGTHRGPLLGARVTNLLPGVWSARMPLKLRNRRIETLLGAWAEPWSALGAALGLPDERPALDLAWRALLRNQAHDSICGCSTDAVHERMQARFADAEGLATETTTRVLERLAGLGPQRRVPWREAQDVAVFNPSPHDRTDVVRVPLDGFPAMTMSIGVPDLHPLVLAALAGRRFTVDGAAARVVPSADPARVRWLAGQQPLDLELVATDVPAFGWRRFRVEPAPEGAADLDDVVDAGREVAAGEVSVRVADDGTLTVRLGAREWPGLLGLEDVGDRGDSYDHDPVGPAAPPAVVAVAHERRRHVSGLERLVVRRTLRLPAGLDGDREGRGTATVDDVLTVEARVAPGVARVDLLVTLDHTARDHRLRLRFPTAGPPGSGRAATTCDTAPVPAGPPAAPGWVHPAPATFPHQGWVGAGDLVVVAPGLPEAELTPDGDVLVTLVRAVGWLARMDLRTRPVPAGPEMPAPGAQVPGRISARLALLAAEPGGPERAAADAERGLWGVLAGPEPLLAPGRRLVRVEPASLLLEAYKPADDGDGIVARIRNPGDEPCTATLRVDLPFDEVVGVALDESPAGPPPERDGAAVRVVVPPHAQRSLRLRVPSPPAAAEVPRP